MNRGEQVVAAFWDLFNKKNWLDGFQMKEKLKGFNPSELHCIEYIGKNKDMNVTKMADAFYMTRSAISKLTKKLIKKQLIESYQKEENKKEIFFRLTEEGKILNNIHNQLHDELSERDEPILKNISDEQLKLLLHFAETYSEHLDMQIKQLGVDIRSEDYDKL